MFDDCAAHALELGPQTSIDHAVSHTGDEAPEDVRIYACGQADVLVNQFDQDRFDGGLLVLIQRRCCYDLCPFNAIVAVDEGLECLDDTWN